MFRKFSLALALLAMALPGAHGADGSPPYTLAALRAAARAAHPSLEAARAFEDAGRAQVTSAAAYPNPEVEFLAGRTQARATGVAAGASRSLSLTQRIDNPWQRDARIDVAGFALDARRAETRSAETELLARLDQRFFELLRRQAELRASTEDLGLAAQIRSKVAVRVKTGESPRYELIKADTELLNAQKVADSAALRVAQARAALRGLAGPSVPADFEIEGSLAEGPVLPGLDQLRAEVLARNPELLRAQADVKRAGRQLELERLRRHPDLALKVSEDRDVEVRDSRIGVQVTVPIWDRRQGPVAEANALLLRSRSEAAGQELILMQSLEASYRQYEIARTQVNALENGILREAEAALKVAEAAYRFGERGILDYLDAQRVFRAARNELISARYELQLALVEIQRLRAQP